MSKSEQDQRFFSSINKSIDQIEETTPYNVSQNLNYYYTLDENNIFALEAQHVIKDEDPFYNAILEDKLNYDSTAANLGLDETQSNYNLAQEKRVHSNQLDAKLDYWNILNKKSNINLTFGTILSHQTFDSNIFQFLDKVYFKIWKKNRGRYYYFCDRSSFRKFWWHGNIIGWSSCRNF
mgnify:CR=1 FL=1